MNQTRTYTYDAENRIISVSGDVSATYVYDAQGRRARKTVNGDSNDFLYDLSGHAVSVMGSNGGWQRGEVFVGGLHLATYSQGETWFAYSDWMGTERVRTDPAANVWQYCTWTDFGSLDNCSSSYSYTDPVAVSPHGYAGYEYDKETGLDHTWFRYYNPRLGRFMTTDPYDGSMDLSDPQSMNRYAYVGGNPTNLFDPFGLEYVCTNTSINGVPVTGSGTCIFVVEVNAPKTPDVRGGLPGSGGHWGDGSFVLPEDALAGIEANGKWWSDFGGAIPRGFGRAQGQSFNDCFRQNVSQLTGDKVDLDKVAKLYPAGLMATALAQTSVPTWAGKISVGSAILAGLTGAMRMSGGARILTVTAGVNLLRGAAVATAAVGGATVGSVANCAAEGVRTQ